MGELHIASLNLEGKSHLGTRESEGEILKWLRVNKPGAFAVQELYLEDIPRIAQVAGPYYIAAAMCRRRIVDNDYNEPLKPWGVAIFSQHPIRNASLFRYGGKFHVPIHREDRMSSTRILVYGEIDTGEEIFPVSTAHFTWTNDGFQNQRQLRHAEALRSYLSSLKEGVTFVADTNTPRGQNSIWDQFSEILTDNIPKTVKTTIDHKIHRAGGKIPQLVVDGFFTSEAFVASDINIRFGFSDHGLVEGRVRRRGF